MNNISARILLSIAHSLEDEAYRLRGAGLAEEYQAVIRVSKDLLMEADKLEKEHNAKNL